MASVSARTTCCCAIVVTPAVENVPAGPAGPVGPGLPGAPGNLVHLGHPERLGYLGHLEHLGPPSDPVPRPVGWARRTGLAGGANQGSRHIENVGLAEEAEERGSEDAYAIFAGS